ncbi:D-alanyl-D-alanine carboxypeptidase/D-alanyl-D-alanine endopeptidase [Corynebacterium epidermidicanis]|uniref:D-alanyl-D-alanine carboxypeptidase, serine-type, PBP4 family n=1 Tax=Corynebacterium epidermidicanis TaxID=1050174 RepID=A0A0G3GS82_9CORY|nr:D-alanyl-D-alanine carboxypeptidase/D-alanyl-D-alanine-endopeptidase [Corynebacterium epidermidicanis]AKK03994.1 D-alanyl-D-alanine carboxypeptidase, serine-type, PBP4 family [Corynebacterium epidermidicanis]
MLKKVGWVAAVGVTVLAVGGVSTFAVVKNAGVGELTYAPASTIAAPTRQLPVANGPATDVAQLRTKLDRLAADPRLGTLTGQVSDASTGEIVWEKASSQPSRPASTTKVLTAAAALHALGPDDRIATEVVAAETGTVVIKAAGDVWMTAEQLDELARQIGSAQRVLIDTSAWTGTDVLQTWNPEDIDAGYIAPMQPAMLYGGRIGAKTGDVPRTHQPALAVAQELALRLDATAGTGTAPQGATVVARVESPPLSQRLEAMMLDSDNVMAEAIGREVAIKRGTGSDFAAAVAATQDCLRELGIDLTGLDLKDNSGLSESNRNTPRLLNQVLLTATQRDQLRPLLAALPVAGGNGTLAVRYQSSPARGWVRAKTGTLTGTSALAGYAVSEQGHVYTFALLSNDSDILPARVALDEFAAGLR